MLSAAQLLVDAVAKMFGGRRKSIFAFGLLCGYALYASVHVALDAASVREPAMLDLALPLLVAAGMTAPFILRDERYPERYRDQIIAAIEILRLSPAHASDSKKAAVIIPLIEQIAKDRLCGEADGYAVLCRNGEDGFGRRQQTGAQAAHTQAG